MESSTVTITAETLIGTDGNGEQFVQSVILTGVNFAHPETIRDIAQEAIDSAYGSVDHKRIAIFTHEDWQNMRRGQPEAVFVPVHTFI